MDKQSGTRGEREARIKIVINANEKKIILFKFHIKGEDMSSIPFPKPVDKSQKEGRPMMRHYQL